ncbi:MAG: TetR/AcrR family transcriptional regulator [Acidocella sp.]|uniref:TetR/AcrR family transcriptional regulator n=1 Tax=Acidocella sp. TaxID=50710 RepID=UPI003FC81189
MSETTCRGRGRPKAVPDEAQRAIIVACARELFLEKGYGCTTTEDIAVRCHISKQTLYRLFPDKSAIFAAVIDGHSRTMFDLSSDYDNLPLEEALERMFKVNISEEAENERVALLRLIVAESMRFPELGAIVKRNGYERLLQDLTDWLAYQRTRGLIETDDIDCAARMLMNLVFGSIITEAVSISEWSGAAKRQADIRRCIAVFLNGVRPR